MGAVFSFSDQDQVQILNRLYQVLNAINTSTDVLPSEGVLTIIDEIRGKLSSLLVIGNASSMQVEICTGAAAADLKTSIDTFLSGGTASYISSIQVTGNPVQGFTAFVFYQP